MLIRLITILLIPGAILAQPRLDIDEHINDIIAQGDETGNQAYYDLLVYFYDNPINLNKTNQTELRQLKLLSEQQVEQILRHRQTTGKFHSLYELQAIAGLPVDDIRRLWPFVIVTEDGSLGETFRDIRGSGNNYLTTSFARLLEETRGFSERIYLGPPEKAQLRLRLRSPGKLSIGLALQKDPGEPWLHDRRFKHPDYVTGHLFLENHGPLKQLTLGDYRLQFGQGLVLGAGFMAGKNVATVTSVKQVTSGILPYSSVMEANFFRGGALAFELMDNLDLSLFYSNQHLDATPIPDQPGTVSSIRLGGLHRTVAEIAAMDQLHEQVWGGALHYRAENFAAGLLFQGSHFDKEIIPAQRAYNFYRFSGRKLMNFSLFGEYRFNNFTWFGEVAQTLGAGMAINSGLLGQVSKFAGLSLSVRYLEPNFQSLYGQSFTERSVLGNENGIYWGLKLHPANRLTISAYYDLYKFPWIISTTTAPAHGTDMMVRLEYKFSKVNSFFLQGRSEIVESSRAATPVDLISTRHVLKTIANFDYSPGPQLAFRSRVQYNQFNQEENGLLLLQDINYNTINFGLSGRILFFDTESYDTRQYVYEKDMLFSYLTRAYHGRGTSYYLIVKYKPIRPLTLRAKISFTEYIGTGTIGSGYNLIEGNTRTQVAAQVHYKF